MKSIKTNTILLLCMLNTFSVAIQLVKDDGSMEWGENAGPYDHYGQCFDMPPSYALLSTQVYKCPFPQEFYIYASIFNFNNPDNPTYLGYAQVFTSGDGWNSINLTSIVVPYPKPDCILISVNSFEYSWFHIGIDSSQPDYHHWNAFAYDPTWFEYPHNVGIRLTIDNNPISVEPASIGNIKAAYSK